MDIIEKIARTELKGAVERPPEGVWSSIESRMDSMAAAKPSSGLSRRGWMGVAAASTAVVVAAAVLCVALFRPRPQPVVVAQKGPQPVAAVATDSSVATVDKSAEVAAPVQQAVAVSQVQDKPVQKAVAETKAATASVQPKAAAKPVAVPAAALPKVQPVDDASVAPVVETKTSEPKPVKVEKAETQPVVASERDTAVQRRPEPPIAIPNLLTPNGDGYNDCWVIPNLEQYGTVQVQIYTAKSKRIFSSADYRNDFCGDSYADGNYFYVIQFRDLNVSRRGVLVIKR